MVKPNGLVEREDWNSSFHGYTLGGDPRSARRSKSNRMELPKEPQALYRLFQEGGLKFVRELLDAHVQESSILDFKCKGGTEETTTDGKKKYKQALGFTDSDKKNLAKAISGFANTDGGVIVWGIDAPSRGAADAAEKSERIANPKGFAAEIRGRLATMTQPPIADVDCHVILDMDDAEPDSASGQKKQVVEFGYVVMYVPKAKLRQFPVRSNSSGDKECYQRVGTAFAGIDWASVHAARFHRLLDEIIDHVRSPIIILAFGATACAFVVVVGYISYLTLLNSSLAEAHNYRDGIGVPRDQAKYVETLDRVARNGNLDAQIELANFYIDHREHGPAAIAWLVRVADENNFVAAQSYLCDFYFSRREFTTSHHWAKQAAQAGDVKAEYVMGKLYLEHRKQPVHEDLRQARRWFELSASKNYPPALLELAQMYDKGIGGARDPWLANEYYEKAAKLGHPCAEYYIALTAGNGDVRSRLPGLMKSNLDLLKDAAQKGHALAQSDLGNWYYKQKKPDEAAVWFKAAIDNDSGLLSKKDTQRAKAEASYGLGNILFYERGSSADKEAGLKWLNKAADYGFVRAWTQLGIVCSVDGQHLNPIQAWEYLKVAARKGVEQKREDPWVWFTLAYLINSGLYKAPREEAFKFLHHAAEIDPSFQIPYGQWLLKYGKSKQAKRAFEEAAKHDFSEAEARFELALMEGGAARQENLKKSAELGFVKAHVLLHNDAYKKKRYEQAAYWCERAATTGDAAAQYQLSYYYIRGIGLSMNFEKGMLWLEKAARAGHKDAIRSLSRLQKMPKGGRDSDNLLSSTLMSERTSQIDQDLEMILKKSSKVQIGQSSHH